MKKLSNWTFSLGSTYKNSNELILNEKWSNWTFNLGSTYKKSNELILNEKMIKLIVKFRVFI